MIKSNMTVSFPKRPDMTAVTRVTANQALRSQPVQQAFARAIAEPPKSQKKPPSETMTPKQLRWMFANIALPYQRTGGVTDGWRLTVVNAVTGAVLSLFNRVKAAKWVHGTATGKHQQAFLRANGWTPTPEIRRATFAPFIAQMRMRFAPNLRDDMRNTGGF